MDMASWDGWPLDRAIVAFTAVLFAGIWVQLTLMHWAGAFKHWAMWGPVLYTPLVVLVTALAAISRSGLLGTLAVVVLAIAVVEGLVGLYFHVRGIAYQIGGITLRNMMAGPPPVLPLAYALAGVLGLGALVWNA